MRQLRLGARAVAMRILTFTNLYPNAVQPRHGIFVEHRIRQLMASGEVSVRVVAPVPWVPRGQRWLGRYAPLAQVPEQEVCHGIQVWHPRFFALPRVTSWLNPLLMAAGALPLLRRLRQEADFDLIDAHFFYPDGAAAILLGAWLDKPVVVTARGTDVNDFPRYRVPRAWIKWVTRRSAAMVTVSAALRRALLGLGVPADRVTVLRNGVDLDLFVPAGRDACRRELNVGPSLLISVGHLIPDKGHHLVIEALASLPDVSLMIAGDGPMQGELRALARRLGVDQRIGWAGTVNQQQLARYYAAADATVLASRLEGMPNVLLESLACGTPVIATNVGGNAEIVSTPVAGVLMKDRSAQAIVDACRQLAQAGPDRDAVRRHAQQFAWSPTTEGLLRLFATVLGQSAANGNSRRDSVRALV